MRSRESYTMENKQQQQKWTTSHVLDITIENDITPDTVMYGLKLITLSKPVCSLRKEIPFKSTCREFPFLSPIFLGISPSIFKHIQYMILINGGLGYLFWEWGGHFYCQTHEVNGSIMSKYTLIRRSPRWCVFTKAWSYIVITLYNYPCCSLPVTLIEWFICESVPRANVWLFKVLCDIYELAPNATL